MKCIVTTKEAPFAVSDTMTHSAPDGYLTITDDAISEIEGFGGCFNELGYRALNTLSPQDRSAILDDLFLDGECGFSFCRLPIGANDFALDWYSYDECEGDYALEKFSIERDRQAILPYVKEALVRQPQMRLFASPWSPPCWLKTNGAYMGGRLKPDARSREAYARYLTRYINAYRNEGVFIHCLHPQNEVTADQIFPSCLYSGEELLDFIDNYLAPAVRRDCPDCEIWLGTLNSESFEEYIFRAFSRPVSRANISGVGYQWIGKEAIQKTRDAYPELPVIQTESECGDGCNTFEYAEYIFSLMQHYFRNGARAYVYWNLVLGKDPRSTWGWAQNSLFTVDGQTHTFRKNPEYYLMKHFSAFVKRGDKSVGCTGEWSPNAVAFRSKERGIAVILHNPLDDCRTLEIACPGRKSFRVKIYPHSFQTIVIDE